MLRSFYYLNEPTLNEFVSAMEDGLRERRTDSQTGQSSREGSVDFKAITGGRSSMAEEGRVVETADDAPARFDRLMRMVRADPEASGWVDVTTLDDLEGLGLGALIEVEVELSMPDVVKIFSTDAASDLSSLAEIMNSMAGLAGILGEDAETLGMDDLPSADQMESLGRFTRSLKSDLVFVGEDDSDRRVAMALQPSMLRRSHNELEDTFRVVAKVGRAVPPGEHKLLLGLPGMSLLPRAERRAMEKKRPKPDEMDQYLSGPATMLDVLAIYR